MKKTFLSFLTKFKISNAADVAEKGTIEEAHLEASIKETEKLESEIKTLTDANAGLVSDLKLTKEASAKFETDLKSANEKATKLEGELKTSQEEVTKTKTDLEISQKEVDKYVQGGGAPKREGDSLDKPVAKEVFEYPHEKAADELLGYND